MNSSIANRFYDWVNVIIVRFLLNIDENKTDCILILKYVFSYKVLKLKGSCSRIKEYLIRSLTKIFLLEDPGMRGPNISICATDEALAVFVVNTMLLDCS